MVNIEEMEIDPTKESLKNEVLFRLNSFKTTAFYTGLEALAIKIRDLVLMEKNTNPANISMGIGIRNYLMDLASEELLEDLANATLNQINKFIPTDKVKDVEYRYINNDVERNALYLFIYLNKTNDEFEADRVAIRFSGGTIQSTEISTQIYL